MESINLQSWGSSTGSYGWKIVWSCKTKGERQHEKWKWRKRKHIKLRKIDGRHWYSPFVEWTQYICALYSRSLAILAMGLSQAYNTISCKWSWSNSTSTITTAGFDSNGLSVHTYDYFLVCWNATDTIFIWLKGESWSSFELREENHNGLVKSSMEQYFFAFQRCFLYFFCKKRIRRRYDHK